MSKWIKFLKEINMGSRKTDVYLVETKDGNQCIALIKWYAPWRKYALFPNPNTVFETQCLKDITDFIEIITLERKLKKAG